MWSAASDVIQGLGRDVGTVRPHHSTPVDEETSKERGVFERLEHGSVEPLGTIDRVFRSVVEHHMEPERTTGLGTNDGGQELHGLFSTKGSIASSVCPAFIFSQFAWR